MNNVFVLFVAVFLLPAFAAYAKHHEKKEESDPSVPPVVTPGVHGTPDQAGTPPSDALVLFDGKNFDHWESGKGEEVKWKIVDGAMEVVRGTGTIQTKMKLGYGQYHGNGVRPRWSRGPVRGEGIRDFFPLGGPEVQVLDSYENSTYSHGQAGAVYNRYPPLVNACRAPGVWQTYDVIVHAPILDDKGKYLRKAPIRFSTTEY